MATVNPSGVDGVLPLLSVGFTYGYSWLGPSRGSQEYYPLFPSFRHVAPGPRPKHTTCLTLWRFRRTLRTISRLTPGQARSRLLRLNPSPSACIVPRRPVHRGSAGAIPGSWLPRPAVSLPVRGPASRHRGNPGLPPHYGRAGAICQTQSCLYASDRPPLLRSGWKRWYSQSRHALAG
jgi:hypothetical protein